MKMNKRVVVGLLVLVLLASGPFGLKYLYDNYHLPEPVENLCEVLGFIEGKPFGWKPVDHKGREVSPSSSSSHAQTVEYSVTGYGSAMITMANAQGGIEQITKILPWSTSFKAQRGTILSLVAQKQGDDARTMTVEIKVSGKTIRTSKSSAAYGMATASAIVD